MDLPYLSLTHFNTWIGKFCLIEIATPLPLVVEDENKTGSKPPVAVVNAPHHLDVFLATAQLSTFSFLSVLQAITDYIENVKAPRCVVMSILILFQITS